MKSEFRTERDPGNRRESAEVGGRGEGFRDDWVVTIQGLAGVLKVSLKTVERMLKNGDITRMKGLPSDVVRFYLPDVLEELRQGKQKFGRKAAMETTGLQTIDCGPGESGGREFEQEGTEIAEGGQKR